MSSPSKAKGSRFEIMIYNDMKTYLRDVKRVGGSGTQKGENGDIIATLPEEVIPYCIECKHYKTLTFAVIDKWWEKIKRQAAEIDMTPLLIYRQNRQKIMVRTIVKFKDSLLVGDIKYNVWKKIIMR